MAEAGNTKQKILDVAEVMFAQHGFNNTSLRMITGKANVNLASVNYHFGDKKSLVRAVLNRYLQAFMPALGQQLDQLLTRETFEMTDVLAQIRDPLLDLNKLKSKGASRFMLLIGRGYTDVQGHLRWFITNEYSDVFDKFMHAVKEANPHLEAQDIFWRMHFTLGACVFTMASSQALAEIVESSFDKKVDTEAIIDQLLPYLAAGFNTAAFSQAPVLRAVSK
ncbi:MAG: TetR/AcrR family transcriptional regulator [Vibrio sp.]